MSGGGSIVAREEWLVARAELLEREKAHTHARAELAAARRRLPRVRLEETYEFVGANGPCTLADAFGNQSQLIVYHLMFGPGWDAPCIGCTGWANAFNGTTEQFAHADAQLIAVSRAPWPQLEETARARGWTFNWLSSADSDFNYDYYASSRDTTEGATRIVGDVPGGEVVEFDRGENHGVSVFSKDSDGTLYHHYSSYNRGIEALNGAMGYFDLLPKGRAW